MFVFPEKEITIEKLNYLIEVTLNKCGLKYGFRSTLRAFLMGIRHIQLCSRLTLAPDRIWGTYVVLEIEPRMARCKASTYLLYYLSGPIPWFVLFTFPNDLAKFGSSVQPNNQAALPGRGRFLKVIFSVVKPQVTQGLPAHLQEEHGFINLLWAE